MVAAFDGHEFFSQRIGGAVRGEQRQKAALDLPELRFEAPQRIVGVEGDMIDFFPVHSVI